MKKLLLILLSMIFNISCSSKKDVITEPVNNYNREIITIENDSSGVLIYNNVLVGFVSYPNSYIYDYILPDGDSLRAGYLYSNMPYQIPADDNFHKTEIDGSTIYLKFKEVNK